MVVWKQHEVKAKGETDMMIDCGVVVWVWMGERTEMMIKVIIIMWEGIVMIAVTE
jgi:hypothetical protein